MSAPSIGDGGFLAYCSEAAHSSEDAEITLFNVDVALATTVEATMVAAADPATASTAASRCCSCSGAAVAAVK